MSTEQIRQLNDAFRTTLLGGQIVLTSGVQALGNTTVAKVLTATRLFSAFTDANDPYREHDFGAFDLEGHRFLWKIDYYDKSTQYGSENPADPNVTTRVLTIMLAEEY